MSRAQSYNWELDIDGKTIHVLSLGEFSEGEEGRIEVADGERKYKIRDQIFNVDEIETTILIKKDKYEYNIMQNFVKSGEPRDVFAIARDSLGTAQLTYLYKNCDCAFGKKSAFDRKSKTEETKKYFLIPEDIVEIK